MNEPFVKVPETVIDADISDGAFRLWVVYQMLTWNRQTATNGVLQERLSVSKSTLMRLKNELKVSGLGLKVAKNGTESPTDGTRSRERDKTSSFSEANPNSKPDWYGVGERNPDEYWQPTGRYTPPKPSDHKRRSPTGRDKFAEALEAIENHRRKLAGKVSPG